MKSCVSRGLHNLMAPPGKKPRSAADDPTTTACDWPKCPRVVRFAPQFRSVQTGPHSPMKLAIRCGYCFRVFCLAHALKHFESHDQERFAEAVAKRMASNGQIAKLAEMVAAAVTEALGAGRSRSRPPRRPR